MHHDTLKHLLRRTRVKTNIDPVHVRIYIYNKCMTISFYSMYMVHYIIQLVVSTTFNNLTD